MIAAQYIPRRSPGAFQPAVLRLPFAVSGNTVHAVYTRGGVIYQRSTDGGRTFAAAR